MGEGAGSVSTAIATHTVNGIAVDQLSAAAPALSMAPETTSTVAFVNNLDSYWRLAKMLVMSGVLPKITKPEAAMAIMLKAHEIGIPAMYAFANLHFFDGRLVESAALMAGMAAERCGVTYEVVEWDDERCDLLFHRPGWSKPLPSVFTIEDARRADLLKKDNWKKYPRAMLLARAQAQGVRAIAPDRFGGMHAAEEVRDISPAPQDRRHTIAQALDSTDDGMPDHEIIETDEAAPADDATDDLFGGDAA
jgi:hypothetical protein